MSIASRPAPDDPVTVQRAAGRRSLLVNGTPQVVTVLDHYTGAWLYDAPGTCGCLARARDRVREIVGPRDPSGELRERLLADLFDVEEPVTLGWLASIAPLVPVVERGGPLPQHVAPAARPALQAQTVSEASSVLFDDRATRPVVRALGGVWSGSYCDLVRCGLFATMPNLHPDALAQLLDEPVIAWDPVPCLSAGDADAMRHLGLLLSSKRSITLLRELQRDPLRWSTWIGLARLARQLPDPQRLTHVRSASAIKRRLIAQAVETLPDHGWDTPAPLAAAIAVADARVIPATSAHQLLTWSSARDDCLYCYTEPGDVRAPWIVGIQGPDDAPSDVPAVVVELDRGTGRLLQLRRSRNQPVTRAEERAALNLAAALAQRLPQP